MTERLENTSNILADCLFDVILLTSDLSKITRNHAEFETYDRHVHRANIIQYHEIPNCRGLHRRH